VGAQALTQSLTVAVAFAVLSRDGAQAAPQSVTYKQQVQITRSPDDVAITPGAGGIAVVRASEHWPDPNNGPQGNADGIVVVKTTDGSIALHQGGCTYRPLTTPLGASDLVAVNSQRAVLIGQKHWAGANTTYVDVVDLTEVYGAGAKCLRNWEKTNAGFVNDVALSPDGRFAVVNHRGWISVFQIDGSSVPDPIEFDTQGGDPSFQKDSVVMTQSTGPQSPIKCVVVTNRKVGNKNRTWVYVLDLSTGTPMSDGILEINSPQPPQDPEDNPPHDVMLSPDETFAVVSAGGVVALVDLTVSPAVIRGEYVDSTAVRQYDLLADSLVLTNSQAVTLASTGGQTAWKADVFDVSAAGLTWKDGVTGAGQPHDLDRAVDGQTVVLRTREHIVVLDDIHLGQSSIVKTFIPSPSGRLSTFDATFDSVIVSRAWVKIVPNGAPGGGPRHHAAAIGRETVLGIAGTRVDIVDLTLASPDIVHSELILDTNYAGGAWPSSIRLRPGGQGFAVRCNAEPHDIDPDNPPSGYNSATGEDVWFFTLHDPVGSIFQYEMTSSPLAISDPLDVGRSAVVNIASPYSQTQDTGYIQTFIVTGG
jgi:hypothetical protein